MYKPYETSFRNQSMTIREKLYNISFSYVMFIVILAAIGIVMLYSAANGNWSPWAINQLIRFGMGFAAVSPGALISVPPNSRGNIPKLVKKVPNPENRVKA